MQPFVLHRFPGFEEGIGNGPSITRAAPSPVERLEEAFGQFVLDLVEETKRGVRSPIDQFAGGAGAGIV